ncbi:dihydrofolate reductase family protein [Clostridium saccharoperbutylacetonicum]|uniref:dihydrofolate reductase family protein n=1 Tax=Clostridium saccharoperbutylacetonicum TaxID=36745 RepID=UPI000983D7DA|nr:dihydrofolate reductase family protein [Clostridium saccharoperbutylacetonicum]AQR94671.1 2,5-diamino-6-ribosylamino-4(3H)-pyrimidinone 5'-phosphate reductase [Clostridium saccharoperbutylacetonicum]NSB30512.1 riboflavin-specific deaminase-like protein [Clostridium saccharoperbutylacetonicum]
MKVTLFSQVSIDGKLTLGAGSSSKDLFTLLDDNDKKFIHEFRGKVDGIMVGKKTIDTDNPFLTNRYQENRNPIRIVPTSTMDLDFSSNIFTDNEKTIVVTTEEGKDDGKIDYIKSIGKECLVFGKDKVDFTNLFKHLEKEFNIKSIMLEGGGYLNWTLFEENLVDEIILMQLPIIIGGYDNVSLVDGKGFKDIESLKKFEFLECKPRKNYSMLRFKRQKAVSKICDLKYKII